MKYKKYKITIAVKKNMLADQYKTQLNLAMLGWRGIVKSQANCNGRCVCMVHYWSIFPMEDNVFSQNRDSFLTGLSSLSPNPYMGIGNECPDQDITYVMESDESDENCERKVSLIFPNWVLTVYNNLAESGAKIFS